MNEPKCKLCMQPNVVYTSITIIKIKFNTYIYIRFNQNLDEKSYIGTKNEAVNHLHASFQLTRAMVYFDVINVA